MNLFNDRNAHRPAGVVFAPTAPVPAPPEESFADVAARWIPKAYETATKLDHQHVYAIGRSATAPVSGDVHAWSEVAIASARAATALREIALTLEQEAGPSPTR